MLKKVSKQFLIVSLILTGAASWSWTMVKSGWFWSYGLGFWGPNGHDGIWHIALANSFSKLSFTNPVFPNELVKNYHYGFDILLALLNQITKVPIVNLYFQVLPPLFAITIGLLSYVFVYLWTNSKKAALFSTFFVYFGGSLSWILGKGESAFWSQQSISTLINPPFALSIIFLLLGLISLLKNKKIAAILFFGVLIQIKVYAGLLVLGGLVIATLYELISKGKSDIAKVLLGTVIVSALVFLPFNKNPQSLITWQPFWFLETMMGYSDRLGWARFYSAMTTYKMGDVYIKGLLAYFVAFSVFIIGNFWTRLYFLKGVFKNLDALKIFLISIISAGVLIPLFFLQSGTPWNTIQFIYYSIFLAGILAGIELSKTKSIIALIFIILTVPTTFLTIKDVYTPSRPPAMLSVSEIEALNYLKQQPDGIVLTYPYDKDKANEAVANPPRPLYLYESTAYVSAFSQKKVYLEDEVNLNIMGYDWSGRRKEVLSWYKNLDKSETQDFLNRNNIAYVYWVKPQRAALGDSQLGLIEIFQNKEVIIYRYGKNLSSN